MIKKTFDAIRKLLVILNRQQKTIGLIVLICSLLAAVFETVGVSVIIPLVNVLLNPEELWKNQYVQEFTRLLNIKTDSELIVIIVIGVIAIYIIKNAYFVFYSWIRVKYANKVEREIAVDMMKSYMNRGYMYFLNHNFNEISHGVAGDVNSLYCVINSLLQALSQIAICVFIFALLVVTDWQLALAIIIAAFLCLLIIIFVFRRIMVQAGIMQREYAIKASKTLAEAIWGIKEVLVMRKQRHFVDEYEKNVIQRQNAQVVQTVGGEIPAYIIEAICITGILGVLCIRIVGVENPTAFISMLAAFAVGAFRVLPALGKISVAINNIASSVVGVNSVYENVVEARDSNLVYNDIMIADDREYANAQLQDCIEMKDIVFSYTSESTKVLKELSLRIPKGNSIALVGESGAGKSTLADVLLGVLSPNSGKVLIDGIDIRRIPNRWSTIVGFVPQSIYLSDVSICENVAFGVEIDSIDEERVRNSLKQANILEFVEKLPNGIDTLVGDRGVRLSGGQKQRIGIARALYHNPEVLILDEATSALDNETEASVMEAIESLKGRITMVIIAHRLTTVRNCDKIYEIVGGKAVERKYEDLV